VTDPQPEQESLDSSHEATITLETPLDGGEARDTATAVIAAAAAAEAHEARERADSAAAEAEQNTNSTEFVADLASGAHTEAVTAREENAGVAERLRRMEEMFAPIYDDYAARRAAEQEAEATAEEVTQVDATGSGSGTTADNGPDGSGGAESQGTDSSDTGKKPRPGLRHRKR
jgi:Tfp pilus assembly protein PilV